jgi:hypothetical protein
MPVYPGAPTGRSAGASRDGTQSLTGSARLGHSLSPPTGRQYRDAPSHVPCESSRPGSRRLHAGHRLANQRAPARLLPGQVETPGFDVLFALRHVTSDPSRRGCAPSSWSSPDASRAPFPPRSPRRSSANAAGGGLKPPPAGRLRRASLHLSHSIASKSLAYISGSFPRSWRTGFRTSCCCDGPGLLDLEDFCWGRLDRGCRITLGLMERVGRALAG